MEPKNTKYRNDYIRLNIVILFCDGRSGRSEDVSNKKEEGTSVIPKEVAESLSECGGITGLMNQLPSDAQLNMLSSLYRTCADPIRLKILAMLGVHPLCVCVIKEVLGITDSKLSYHLRVLRKSGLIKGEQQGTWIIYSLTDKGSMCLKR